MSTKLVILGDYDANQIGYNQASIDKAVHIVDIDEQAYFAIHNVQKVVEATCLCSGVSVSLGLVRDGKYISLSVVVDSSWDTDIEYKDLDEAFDLGLTHEAFAVRRLDDLQLNVDKALKELSNALNDCAERRAIDHCIDTLDQHKLDCLS